jgi:outer membrane receptor protein involved in Fe transport
MINGMRVPIQGFSAELIDPSIIAPIATQRVDVLLEGASATYGSDAVAGVINVILRRGYDGAISQVSYSRSTDINASEWVVAQLVGRTWDTGQVTASVSWNHQAEVYGRARRYWTLDFEHIGLDDRRQIGAANPAVVHIGNRTSILPGSLGFASNRGTRNCGNCFTVPAGSGWDFGAQAPGPTTTWTAIQANPGIQSLHDTSETFDALPKEQHTHAAITFDQIVAADLFGVLTDVNLFIDAFYSNRVTEYFALPGASPGRENLLTNLRVPTHNPYYPTGAPSNLRANYNLTFGEVRPRSHAQDISSRYAYGFEAGLPWDWDARLYYAKTYVKNHLRTNGMVNENHVSAALGNTIAASGANGAFVKPGTVPYLNLFCDAQVYRCNSPITLDYIAGFRDYYEHYDVAEWGAQFTGPIFQLPGGPVELAILGNYISHAYFREDHQNYTEHTTSDFLFSREPFAYNVWAVTSQVNVPLVGPNNALPFVEEFIVEGGYRFDNYSNFDHVWTPKLSARWGTGYGLTVRGAWGKAFRAPGIAEASPVSSQIQPLNTPNSQESLFLECEAVDSLGLPPDVANPGSLDSVLNPTCGTSVALVQPGGIDLNGGAGVANSVRGGFALDPEDARSWSVGLNFAPAEGFLTGLNVDFSYWNLRVNGILTGKHDPLDGTNDPRHVVCSTPAPNCTFLVRQNLAAPTTDPSNAVFLAAVQEILENPRNTVDPAHIDLITFIRDNAVTNVGFHEFAGLDFDTRYDFEFGNWGAWHVGWRGTYELTDKDPGGSAFDGNTGGRFPWRARLGWAQGNEGFAATVFLNHLPHSGVDNDTPPRCYWAPEFASSGAGSCYAGSPYLGPVEIFSLARPGLYVWDFNVQYRTGMMFANTPYLQNLTLSFNVRNLFNQEPPVDYQTGSARGEAAHMDAISPLQRYISFAITKTW